MDTPSNTGQEPYADLFSMMETTEYCTAALRESFGCSIDTFSLLIKELWESEEFANTVPQDLLEELKSSFVWMNIMYVYAGEVGMNPFDIFLMLEKVLQLVFKTYFPSGTVIPEITFTESLVQNQKQRSCYMVTFLREHEVPIALRIWCEGAIELQGNLLEKLNKPPSSYALRKTNFKNPHSIYTIFEALLDHTLKDIKVTSHICKGCDVWQKTVRYCRKRIASDLVTIVAEGRVPDEVCPELVLKLSKFRISFGRTSIDTIVGQKAREALFAILSTVKSKEAYAAIKAGHGLESMKQQLTALNLNNKEFTGFLSHICLELRDNVIGLWGRPGQTKEAKRKLVLLSNCLLQIGDTLENSSDSLDTLHKKAPEQAAQSLKAIAFATLHLNIIANGMLKEMIPENYSSLNLSAVEKHLDAPTELKAGFSSTLEIIYNILEAEYVKLYAVDSVLASGLFRFLELTRGLAFFGDRLLAAYGSMDMSVFCCFYDLVSEYLKYCFQTGMKKIHLMDISSLRMCISHAHASFGELLLLKILPTDSDHSIFEFLRYKAGSKKDDRFWIDIGRLLKERDDANKASWTSNIGIPQKGQSGKKKPVKPAPAAKKSGIKASPIHTERSVKPSGKESPLKDHEFVKPPRRITKASKSPIINKASASRHYEERPSDASVAPVQEIITAPAIPILQVKPQEDKTPSKKTNLKSEDEKALTLVDPIQSVGIEFDSFSPFNVAETNALDDLCKIWSGANRRLFSEPNRYPIIRPFAQKQSLALTYDIQEEAPKHHLILAKSVGYKEGSVDPRDYLMALILIGERCRARLQIFSAILASSRGFESVAVLFKEDISAFKKEITMMADINPEMLNKILAECGIFDLETLLKLIKHYNMRVKVTHPMVSKAKCFRDFFAARHLTTLELIGSSVNTRRLRNHLECTQYIPIKKIETQNGRPTYLLGTAHTEFTLAVIGLDQLSNITILKRQRNELAHQTVDDQTFQAYVKYVFGSRSDLNFLTSL